MRLRNAFLLGIGVLVGLQILTSFGAIGLLSRMSPAIEEILSENVHSNEAADEMLSVLALGGTSEKDRARFERAIERARFNVTEPDEIPVLEAIRRNGERAFEGDPDALVSAVEKINELVAINRQAMIRADNEAKRLGTAGAWAAVVLALIGFGASSIVVRQVNARILAPLGEVEDVLDAFRRGDRHRRCRTAGAAEEMRRILAEVNALLDRTPGESLPAGPARG